MALHCVVDDYLWPWTESTPVLMMHGYARNASFWNRWVPAVASSHRVYRPELRGCGASEVPRADYKFSAESIAQDILELMDAHGLERVHWVGESSGGIIGLLLAAAYSERIASVVACNSPIRIGEALKKTYALEHASTADSIRALGVGEWCRRTLDYRLDPERATPEVQRWYVEEMAKTPDHVAAALIECFESVDLMPVLPKIAAPVLLLSGDKSKIASDQQQLMAQNLPNGTVRFIAGYGHGVNLLKPEECAAEALSFWQTLS